VRPMQSDGWYYYELEPTLPNIVMVVNKLFNLQLKNYRDFLKHFNLECGSYAGSEQEQRVSVCAITNENKRTCTLDINPGHGFIAPYPKELSSPGAISKLLREELLSNNRNLLPLINLYGFDYNLAVIQYKQELLNSPYLRHIMLIQLLANTTNKLLVMQSIGVNLPTAYKNKWCKWFVAKLIDELFALNDPHTTSSLLETWADFAYNWGMSQEFQQKFKVHYKEISAPKIIANFFSTVKENDKPAILSWAVEAFKGLDQGNHDEWLQEIDFYAKEEVAAVLLPEFLKTRVPQIISAEQQLAKENKSDNVQNYGLLIFEISTIMGLSFKMKLPQFKEELQILIEKLLPKVKNTSKFPYLGNFLNALVSDSAYFSSDFVKKMVINSFKRVNDETEIKFLDIILEKIEKQDKELPGRWGQDFINQLEAMRKDVLQKSATPSHKP
jgi:hypothetical protein